MGGSRQHKRNNKNKWGFHSVLSAMTRDPAEFGWHYWSNTAHPPPSSTTYVASQMPSPLLPLPQGCLYKATPWQQQMPIRTASPTTPQLEFEERLISPQLPLFHVVSEEDYTEEGIPSPLAPSLLVTFYDTQRIRWCYSLLYAQHHRAYI